MPTYRQSHRSLFVPTTLAASLFLIASCGSAPHGARRHHVTHQHGEDMRGAEVAHAVCVLRPVGDSPVGGTIELHAEGDGVRIRGTVRGLSPGLHGFHVHTYGDLRDLEEGKSAGSHFDPHGLPHGRPDAEARHVGDLGNIEANAQGIAEIDLQDRVLSLHGPFSVLGRALVVHTDADKFTQPTGDAGGRAAFGVIGIAED